MKLPGYHKNQFRSFGLAQEYREKNLKSFCMKNRSVTPMGSLHPVLFFAGVYVVVLLFSIFICSALFYSCNSSSVKTEIKEPVKETQHATAGMAMR